MFLLVLRHTSSNLSSLFWLIEIIPAGFLHTHGSLWGLGHAHKAPKVSTYSSLCYRTSKEINKFFLIYGKNVIPAAVNEALL